MNGKSEISKLQFGLLNPNELLKSSVVEVKEEDPFTDQFQLTPRPNGIFDRRMGTTEKGVLCETCGCDRNCVGHFGHIRLVKPCFNPLFMGQYVKILHHICVFCSSLLNRTGEKRRSWCPSCGLAQPRISRSGLSLTMKFQEQVGTLSEEKLIEPDDLHQIFSRITDEACSKLNLNPIHSRPEWMVITILPVSPPVVRPSLHTATISSFSDLSFSLLEIIRRNNLLKGKIEKKDENVDEFYVLLQHAVYTMINNEDPSIEPMRLRGMGKRIKSLAERIGRKGGRIRYNLMGKRTSFSGRSVITGDPSIGLEEVGIPIKIAMNLTVPTVVTKDNMSEMRELVRRGALVHPGARFIRRRLLTPSNVAQTDQNQIIISRTIDLARSHNPADRRLEVGDIIDRHLHDGDVVIMNRQPTLHKLSMLGMKAKIVGGQSFRLNVIPSPAFNYDFDGDEMNIHVPQSDEAIKEVKEKMMVSQNIIYEQFNRPQFGLKLDSIICNHLLTKDGVLLTRSQMMGLAMAARKTEIPNPAIKTATESFWTGKQAFSLALPPINFRTGIASIDNPPVIIQKGELLSGSLDSKILEKGQGALAHSIGNDFGPSALRDYLDNAQLIAIEFASFNSFSIGLDDLTSDHKLKVEIGKILHDTNLKADQLIIQRKNHTVKLIPGLDEERSFEKQIEQLLSGSRDQIGNKTLDLLGDDNRLKLLVKSGARGDTANAAQMISTVGQQVVDGKRINLGFYSGRSSLNDQIQEGDLTPVGRGFIAGSFFSGLTPSEFFFQAASGREGLANTKVKTGVSGYMQRRLNKLMEDLSVHPDGSVRNASGLILQFQYGDDAMNAKKLENVTIDPKNDLFKGLDKKEITCPFNPNRLLFTASLNSHPPFILDPKKIDQMVEGFANKLNNHLHRQVMRYYFRGENVIKSELSEIELRNALQQCVRKSELARIKTGEMVGSLAAQCIGEPLTQAILKSFHHTGVSGKDATQGVPRVAELIDLKTNIKTPSMTLKCDQSKFSLGRVMLRDLVATVTVGLEDIDDKLVLRWFETTDQLDRLRKSSNEMIRFTMKRKINMKPVIQRIEDDLEGDVVAYGAGDQLCVRLMTESVNSFLDDSEITPSLNHDNYNLLLVIRNELMNNLLISGYRDVVRVYPKENEVETDGSNLLYALGMNGVDSTTIVSNSINEMFARFGIEVARAMLLNELISSTSYGGTALNSHHVQLLVDAMTVRGYLMPVTRNGMNRISTSPLLKASFEEMVDMLGEAAMKGDVDFLNGVSERIITGKMI